MTTQANPLSKAFNATPKEMGEAARAQSAPGAKTVLRESRKAELRRQGDLVATRGLVQPRSGPKSLGAGTGKAKPAKAQGKAPRAEGAPAPDSSAPPSVVLRFKSEAGDHLCDVAISLTDWERMKKLARLEKIRVQEWIIRGLREQLEVEGG